MKFTSEHDNQEEEFDLKLTLEAAMKDPAKQIELELELQITDNERKLLDKLNIEAWANGKSLPSILTYQDALDAITAYQNEIRTGDYTSTVLGYEIQATSIYVDAMTTKLTDTMTPDEVQAQQFANLYEPVVATEEPEEKEAEEDPTSGLTSLQLEIFMMKCESAVGVINQLMSYHRIISNHVENIIDANTENLVF
eukprot:UN29242